MYLFKYVIPDGSEYILPVFLATSTTLAPSLFLRGSLSSVESVYVVGIFYIEHTPSKQTAKPHLK